MQLKNKAAIVRRGNMGIGEADEAAAALSVRVGQGRIGGRSLGAITFAWS